MAEHEFPPNSHASKQGATGPKKVEQVTTGTVLRKRRSLRKQFAETFVQGDFRGAVSYMVMDIGLPMAQDLIVEAFQSGVERLFKGESRRRGPVAPPSGPGGYTNYQQMTAMSRILQPPQRTMPSSARARFDFDAIVLESRAEAEVVLERMFDIVNQYEVVTVADLYELVGVGATHTDHKWGWTDLRGAKVARMRGQYFLDLPTPVAL